jgi:cytochrome P450
VACRAPDRCQYVDLLPIGSVIPRKTVYPAMSAGQVKMSAFADLLAGGDAVYGEYQNYVDATRAEGELHIVGDDIWATSYPACKLLINSRKTEAAGTFVEYFGGQVGSILELQENWLETSIGPTHSRRRVVANRAFREKAFNLQVRTRTPVLIKEYLERLGGDFSGNLMSAFAQPLSERLTLEWLGIPPQLGGRFMELLNKIALTMWTTANDDSPSIRNANSALDDLVPDLLKSWGSNGFQLGAGAALRTTNNRAESPLSDAEAISCMINFGFNVYLLEAQIGNLISEALTAGRIQSSAILTDAADALVWELFRLASPAPFTLRRATENFVYRDTKIAVGQWIVLHLGAALRDPQYFTAPGAVDLTRGPSLLAFGFGPHTCLGARMAFDMAKNLLRDVWMRFDIALGGEVEWGEGPGRLVRTLPVHMVGRTGTRSGS